MNRNIAAFTATKYEGYYPPYISINEVDGAVEITIRSPEKDGAEGSHGTITLSKEEYGALTTAPDVAALQAEIAQARVILAAWDISSLPNDMGLLAICEARVDDLQRLFDRNEMLSARVHEAITKVENDRTLWTPEWQIWLADAKAALAAA